MAVVAGHLARHEPLGFGLMVLQGLSEVVKRIAFLMRIYEMDTHYERPLQ